MSFFFSPPSRRAAPSKKNSPSLFQKKKNSLSLFFAPWSRCSEFCATGPPQYSGCAEKEPASAWSSPTSPMRPREGALRTRPAEPAASSVLHFFFFKEKNLGCRGFSVSEKKVDLLSFFFPPLRALLPPQNEKLSLSLSFLTVVHDQHHRLREQRAQVRPRRQQQAPLLRRRDRVRPARRGAGRLAQGADRGRWARAALRGDERGAEGAPVAEVVGGDRVGVVGELVVVVVGGAGDQGGTVFFFFFFFCSLFVLVSLGEGERASSRQRRRRDKSSNRISLPSSCLF